MINNQLLGGNLSCDTGISQERLMEENSALRKEIRKLRKQVETDSLTDLPNRRYVDRRIANAPSDESGSLLFIDLDDFGVLNKEHGEHVGDAVLMHVASIIIDMVRGNDFVARIGGEEIIVWFSGATVEQAAEKAEDIKKAVRLPIDVDGIRIGVTASIGVAYTESIYDLPETTKRADQAMRIAKKEGKDRVFVLE